MHLRKHPRAPGWLSQVSVPLLISAQVTVFRFVRSSPTSGSALTAQSLPGILSLSLPLPRLLSVSDRRQTDRQTGRRQASSGLIDPMLSYLPSLSARYRAWVGVGPAAPCLPSSGCGGARAPVSALLTPAAERRGPLCHEPGGWPEEMNVDKRTVRANRLIYSRKGFASEEMPIHF